MESENNDNQEIVTPLTPLPSPPKPPGQSVEDKNEEWHSIISSAIIMFLIFVLGWWLNRVL
jgi:hypothetical protein